MTTAPTAEEARNAVNARMSVGNRLAMQSDIEDRTRIHQNRVKALMVAAPNRLALLAIGDSWFDLPGCAAGGFGLGDVSIIAQLQGPTGICNPTPVILNLAHYGWTAEDELILPRRQQLIAALQDGDNWPNGQPDAILFSGGGNDIAGDQFIEFLDAGDKAGLNVERLQGALAGVKASYLSLFALRDEYAPGVPIVGHTYDFAQPSGVGTICGIGPWLKPSLDAAGITDFDTACGVVKTALTWFGATVSDLAADPRNLFVVAPTQGTVTEFPWPNELHPDAGGFAQLANVVGNTLRGMFAGRV